MSDLDPRLAVVAQLKSLVASEDLDLNPLLHAFAQQISGKAVESIQTSIGELVSIGVDPDKYISVPRSYYRNARDRVRVEAEAALLADQRAHAKRMQDEEYKRAQAATAALTAASTPGLPTAQHHQMHAASVTP